MQQKIYTNILLLCLFLSCFTLKAQQTFYKFYGSPNNSETAAAVAELPSGGFVLTGKTGSHQSDNDDIFLTRTDANGHELWTVYFGGPENEVATGISVASNGQIYICGYTSSLNGANSDGFVLKTDANGALIWSKNLGLPNRNQITAITAVTFGGCLFTVNGFWNTPGDQQARVVKFSDSGTQQWALDYASTGKKDELWAVAPNSDDYTYVMAGNYNGSSLLTKFSSFGAQWTAYPTDTIVQYGLFVLDLAISPVNNNIAVVGHSAGIAYLNLFSPNGAKLWARRIPSPANYEHEMNVAFKPNGEIIATDNQTTVIFSPTGNVLAQNTFAAAPSFMSTVKDVIGTKSGQCVHAGTSTGNNGGEDAALSLSNSQLQIQWQETYGITGPPHSEEGKMVRQTPDGGYILCGTKYSPANGADFYLIKTDALGVVEWENLYGGPGSDFGRSVAPDPTTGGYVLSGYSFNGAGWFWSVRSIDATGVPVWSKEYYLSEDQPNTFSSELLPLPGSGYVGYAHGNMGVPGNPKLALLYRLDASGNIVWTQQAGNSNFDSFHQLIRTSDGGFAAVGEDYAPPVGYKGAWIAKFNANGTKIWDNVFSPSGNNGFSLGYGLAEMANGNLVMSSKLDNDLTGKDSLCLSWYNANGTLLSRKFYQDSGQHDFCRIHRDNSNQLIVSTNYFAPSSPDSLLILKTDQNGNVLTRQAQGISRIQFFYESQVTSDGGSICIGIARNGNSDDIALVKTDASGKITETFSILKNRLNLSASPLPSAGTVNLNLECGQTGQVVFRLFDLSGRLVLEKTASKTLETLCEHFDLTALQGGTYFWQVEIGQQRAGLQWIKY